MKDNWYFEYLCLLPTVSLAVALIAAFVGIKFFRGRGILGGIGAGILVFLFILTNLNSKRDAWRQTIDEQTDQARNGAYITLWQLPFTSDMEEITTSGGASPLEDSECSVAQIYGLYGTKRAAVTTVENFVRQLKKNEWSDEGQEYEKSRGFIQGDKVYLNVDYSDKSYFWINNLKYSEYVTATTKYSGTVTLRVDYMLPNRKICWGR